jgi:acyl-CoA thioesterase I
VKTVSQTEVESYAGLVFIGDSITDAGRDRTDPESLGEGFVALAHDLLAASLPELECRWRNHGVAGETSREIAVRCAEAFTPLPQRVFLMCGVNDIWCAHGEGTDRSRGQSAREYIDNLAQMLESCRGAGAGLVLLEPFYALLPGQGLRPQLELYLQALREFAHTEGLPLVPIQAAFDRAMRFHAPQLLAEDSVHPTRLGISVIALEVLQFLGVRLGLGAAGGSMTRL